MIERKSTFSVSRDLFICMRPDHWAKNGFLFVGVIFSKNLFNADLFLKVFGGFVLFSLAASSIYLFNDIRDRESDRTHPQKRQRPIASGRVSLARAYVLSIFLASTSLAFAFTLERGFFAILVWYILLQIAYSLRLKRVVILDIMSIALGFILRVFAGTTLAGVEPSDWLIVCTLTASLFLGFSKRRSELVLMEGETDPSRKVLKEYSVPFLDQMIAMVTACTVMSYILYTVSGETVARFGTRSLALTIPFVLFGIFRYLYLIYHRNRVEDPVDLILKDGPSLLNAFLWIGSILVIIYSGR